MKHFNNKTRSMMGQVQLLYLVMEEGIRIEALKCFKTYRWIETLVKEAMLVKNSFFKILASKVKMVKWKLIVELIKEF